MAKRQSLARKATKKRKTAAPRRRKTATAGVKETTRLRRELAEALERQRATSEILAVISRSTLGSKPNLKATLETLLASAIRLCGATRGHVFRYDGNLMRFVAASGLYRPSATGFRHIRFGRALNLYRDAPR